MSRLWQSRNSTQDCLQILSHSLLPFLALPHFDVVTDFDVVTNTIAYVFFSPSPKTGPIWILKYSMTTHLFGGWVQYRHLPKEITESHSGRALGSEMRDGILASILPKITQMTRGEACAGQGSFWSYPGHWLLVHVLWHVQAPEKKVR